MSKLYYILIFATIMMLQSCSTTEKFMVNAPAGSNICSLNGRMLATVTTGRSTGVEVEVTSDACYEMMLVKTPNFPIKIPFGLDFKHRNVNGVKLVEGLGITANFLGGLSVITGGIIAIAGGEGATVGIPCGIGAALIGAGMGFGWPAGSRISQTAYKYEFRYNKVQSPQLTGLTTTLLHPDPEKQPSVDQPNTEQPTNRTISSKIKNTKKH